MFIYKTDFLITTLTLEIMKTIHLFQFKNSISLKHPFLRKNAD